MMDARWHDRRGRVPELGRSAFVWICRDSRYLAASAFLVIAACAAACGGNSTSAPTMPAAAWPPTGSRTTQIESVTDGDTVRISPALSGAVSVRFLNIDSAELNGDTQEPWASRSRDNHSALHAPGAQVAVATDREELDTFGRLLGHVLRSPDALSTNREQLRTGHAVLYVLWPNTARFEDYRAAQIEAQDRGAGIWSQAEPLAELPFEHRLRTQNRPPSSPVGDYFTRRYVDARSYRVVHVNNRVFLGNDAEATGAGFNLWAHDADGYDPACLSAGR